VARRSLVTGAAGVIGFELARALLARGESVVCADTGRKWGLEDLRELVAAHAGRAVLVEADLARSPDALEGHFDAIYHLAAIVGVKYVSEHPWETLDVNLRSTLNVLEHAVRTRPDVVMFASSSENYATGVDAGFVPVPTPEDVVLSIGDIALPRWSYAASKIAGESALFAAAREGGFAPAVVRFHNVYGPRMGPTHVVPEFLERCRARVDPFPVFGPEQTRSFLYVSDAARAVVALVDAAGDRERIGVWNVGSGVETRIDDLARLAFQISGHHPRVRPEPAPPGSVARRVPDVARLSALGFRPEVDLEAGLRACWRALTDPARRPPGP
jgi:UDP-glucose 4-epimerase/UDP-glucuronate decarboxylase